ncbi:DUF4369 domain-containing protein [Mariniflexile litorale]|uniref:DUF4369 domain-containing protein n=1 Tax=Mariniflexile litorale TaxID=3045158 RepID=A0AAU7EDM4_9FLAO|nr:DUF4369 domain-containing protein [Mariniflexile sp. KMM 9835]MDQ8210364.1 DUF4369 domain-containing protein [Mariniflexile sp. KMM 9835]
MKKILYIIFSLLIFACSKEQNDLTVKVEVNGLKKGVLYLKKVKNENLITIDTIAVNGQSDILLHASSLESPEVFYLFLDKNSSEKDQIVFFADKGVTEIKTNVKNFGYGATINGSEQQKIFEEYKLMKTRFNGQNLDLIKENFEALKKGDTSKSNAIQKKSDNNLKRRYLFTVNFALNHKDSEVAPYLALTEIYNARVKFLDTINNSLTPKVKASKYGKELQVFIDNIKQAEK